MTKRTHPYHVIHNNSINSLRWTLSNKNCPSALDKHKSLIIIPMLYISCELPFSMQSLIQLLIYEKLLCQ